MRIHRLSTHRLSRRLGAPAVLGCAILLASCGLPDGRTVEVPPGMVPSDLDQARASNTPSRDLTPGAPAVVVCFIGRTGVVETGGRAERLEDALSALSAGPTPEQRRAGMTTLLGPTDVVRLVARGDGVVTIDWSTDAAEPAARDAPKAVGQIVLTVTSLPSVQGVRFTRRGKPLDVPLPDGQLASRPVTQNDYRVYLSSGVSIPSPGS